MKNKRKILVLFLLGSLVSMSFLSIYIYKWESREKVFEINFFSLNRGRSIFLRTPKDKTILIGGGQNTDTIRELTKVMPFYNRNIDYIFIPSAAPAQIGGLIEIVDRYKIEEIFLTKNMSTSTVLKNLKDKIKKNNIHIKEIELSDQIEIDGIVFNVIFPDQNFKFNKTSIPELALNISYGSTTLYLFGNLSKTIQKSISKNIKNGGQENIIEFYHSGTDTKVGNNLIEKIKPKYIFNTKEKTTRWISDGLFFKKGII
jgi:competence protein ComEC